jgi:hypothetical protein
MTFTVHQRSGRGPAAPLRVRRRPQPPGYSGAQINQVGVDPRGACAHVLPGDVNPGDLVTRPGLGTEQTVTLTTHTRLRRHGRVPAS